MNEDIFRITPDKERAKSLLEQSKDRIEIMKFIPRDRVYKIVEDYYEIIKELLTAIMYLDGYKTLSHVKLIEYFAENYTDLSQAEIKIIDSMRKSRHGIVYYAEKVTKEFLLNNEKEIISIISVLIRIITKKIEK